MLITIPATSARLDSLFTQTQAQSVLNARRSTTDFTTTIYNPTASANIVYIERFDSVATTTTSLPIVPGTSMAFSVNDLFGISVIAGVAPVDVILG